MKDYIKEILKSDYPENFQYIYDNSPLLIYLDSKSGAIFGDAKTRRSLASIYAIYAIVHFYQNDFFEKKEAYKEFQGYDYTKLFCFYRGLYGGEKLQNHALNSRVNGEFFNKQKDKRKELIINNNGKYALHIDYLYVDDIDISKTAVKIIEKYISILKAKDDKLISDIEELITLNDYVAKKNKICDMINEKAEARMFEIISYAVLKNYYRSIKIYIGYDLEHLAHEYLNLYKTGRTNANDGGIDFVMRPLGRFYQVTEVENYDKYTLDMDKVLHFPITFVIKTQKPKEEIETELINYIDIKSGGMKLIKDRYIQAIEEIITINELREWLYALEDEAIDDLLYDITLYYKLELNLV